MLGTSRGVNKRLSKESWALNDPWRRVRHNFYFLLTHDIIEKQKFRWAKQGDFKEKVKFEG